MLSAATWMNLEMIILNEGSQTEKEKYTGYCSYAESKKKKKKIRMNLSARQKQTHRHRKPTYSCQRRKVRGDGGIK